MILLIDHNEPGTWDPGPGTAVEEIKDDKDPSGKRESMFRLAAEGI